MTSTDRTHTDQAHRGLRNVLRYQKRLFPSLLIVILAVAVGGPAHAVWSGAGSGTGSGTAGTNVAVTLSPATPVANLFPGGQADVVLTISNPNSSTARISSLALDTTQGTSGFSVDASHSGCAVTTYSFTTQTNGTTGWTVPAKVGGVNGTLSVTLTNAVAMSVSAANACQGATATVYLTAS
jgi:hypothetical protein